jgi:glucose/arabinose dehydrogenase
MTFSDKRAPRALRLLAGLGVLAASVPARADLVAPFSNTLDVDPQYVSGATGATDIAWAADGRAVITTKGGTIVIRQTSGTTVQRTNVFSNVSQTAEQGLLGVVADPTAANTFYFYVSNGTDTADRHRVMKAVLNADNTFTVDATPIIAASRNLGPGIEGPANHNGGGMFIYQNRLYVGVGDTGHNRTPPNNKYGSCLNRPNGKILRVELSGAIPTDNPLVNETAVTSCNAWSGATAPTWSSDVPDKRIFAWGFRNPWRFWVDPTSGRMWIGDVGETTREEISTGTGNMHYGWPFNEGTTPYGQLDGKDCMAGFVPGRTCTPAIHDYDNNTQGTCVVGGLIPDGCGWQTALGGTLYLFSDFGSGWIHALTVTNRAMGQASSTATNLGTFATSGPASMRMGPDESLYVVMNRSNGVYRFTPRDRTGCAAGGMGGAGGVGGRGGAGAGGRSGAGGAGGAGTVAGTGGISGAGVGAGAGGVDGGGQAGAVGPGGSSTGGTAGVGVVAGASGTGQVTGGAGGAPGGGVGANGGAPLGGGPSGGLGAVAGSGTPPGGGGTGGSDDSGGCGCRVSNGSGAGYLALALGLAAALISRLRRRGDR